MRYEGMYLHGTKVVIAATIGGTRVLESPGWLDDGSTTVFIRNLDVAAAASRCGCGSHRNRAASRYAVMAGCAWKTGSRSPNLPGGAKTRLFVSRADTTSLEALAKTLKPAARSRADHPRRPARWPQEITTTSEAGRRKHGAFARTPFRCP